MARISLICTTYVALLCVPLRSQDSRAVRLPDPQYRGKISVEEALKQRRSIRSYTSVQVYLQLESLGLGTVLIGAFRDAGVKEALKLPADEDPLVIMPIGRKQ